MSDNFRAVSRLEWHRQSGSPDNSDITVGCLQRIADATELMAKNYQALINERNAALKSKDYWIKEHDTLTRRLVAAKGQITKLKRAKAAVPA